MSTRPTSLPFSEMPHISRCFIYSCWMSERLVRGNRTRLREVKWICYLQLPSSRSGMLTRSLSHSSGSFLCLSCCDQPHVWVSALREAASRGYLGGGLESDIQQGLKVIGTYALNICYSLCPSPMALLQFFKVCFLELSLSKSFLDWLIFIHLAAAYKAFLRTVSYCLQWSEWLCLPHMHRLKCIRQCDSIKGWMFGIWLDHEDSAFMHKISAL